MLDKYKILRAAEKYVIHRKFAQAVREYEKLLQVETPEPILLNTVGDLLLKQGRQDEALNYFHQVAETYHQNGFIVKAIAMYKKIHHLNPADLKINETLAGLYQKQGLCFDAARHLQTLVERYQRLEQLGDALVHLRQLVSLEPGNVETQVLLARMLEQRNERPKAFDHYLQAQRLFRARDQWDKAFEMASKALEIDDTSREALEAYLESGEQNGKLSEVAGFLAGRMESSGQKFPFQMFLARAHEKMDQADIALRMYEDLWELGHYDNLIEEGLQRVRERVVAATEAVDTPAAAEKRETIEEPFRAEEETAFRFTLEPAPKPADEEVGQEEPVEEPAPAETAEEVEAPAVSSLEEALQETDFYLKLGFREEAKRMLEVLLRSYPGDERVLRRAEKVMVLPPAIADEALAAAAPTEAQVIADFELEIDSALEALFSGASSLEEEEVLRYDIAAGSRDEKNSPKIHYDLGLAYKEMGLAQDAIQEFLSAYEMLESPANNPQKILCCSMLANSFLSIKEFDKAIHWARQGLRIPDKKDFEWKALQYDLAWALEKKGDQAQALDSYAEILKRDPAYRDVQRRVEQLTLQAHGQ